MLFFLAFFSVFHPGLALSERRSVANQRSESAESER